MAYTFLPDQDPEPEPTVQPAPAEDQKVSALWLKIEGYIKSHSGNDFYSISPREDKLQFKHQHRQMKRKGGHRPIDFQIVEDFVDLKLAFEQHDLERALTLYFRLKHIA